MRSIDRMMNAIDQAVAERLNRRSRPAPVIYRDPSIGKNSFASETAQPSSIGSSASAKIAEVDSPSRHYRSKSNRHVNSFLNLDGAEFLLDAYSYCLGR